ncbi:acyl-CoA dehydrogenase family protein [Congregibacter brevis]|uniref:Acyl-CoA dehydrogenase family protein n=1 Tax=Congregibacter brevis TaxID=3081201 RepID=A0ABZ0IG59_9GAMM|nr:acyl-CoA dehydrogenase family protein [Congregibacter sp. IMCC45268]
MTLVLNEEQQMLKESAAGFLASKATVGHLRKLRDSGDELGFEPAVWQEMVEMGWAGIAIPEAYGGLGYGYTGLGVVLEQAGRHLSASPLEASVLVGATAINCLGTEPQKATWLAAIAAGERQVTLALQESGAFDPAAVAATATRDGDAYVVSGEKRMVLDAKSADAFVVIARSSGAVGDQEGLSAFLVPADAAGLSVTSCDMVDSRQCGSVALDGVRLTSDALMGGEGDAWAGLDRTLDIAAIGFSAQLLGLSLEAFERTMDYIRERKQFGTVIGSFQGLQHRAAHLFAELELARSIVLKALQAVDADDENLSRLASAAKAKLSEVARLASNEGVQMHGGVGMTDEYDIGLYMKRSRVLEHLMGDYYYHLDRFARIGGY